MVYCDVAFEGMRQRCFLLIIGVFAVVRVQVDVVVDGFIRSGYYMMN